MEVENKISHSQVALLACGSAMGNIVYTFPQAAQISGRAFWVATFFGVLINVPFAFWILFLGSYKRDGTMFDLLEEGLGKPICKLVIVAYFLLNVAVGIGMLNMFAGAIKVFFLPRTPAYVIILLIVAMCTIFAKSGLKYFVRLIAILPVLAMTNYYIGFSLSFFKEFKIENVIPVFDTTLPLFIKAMLFTAGNTAESLFIFMILVKNIPQSAKHYLSVAKGYFAWAVILAVAIMIMEGIVSQYLMPGVAAAGITVSSIILASTFLSGLEVFILFTYQYFVMLKTVTTLYCCWTSARKLFNVPKGKPLLILSALILAVSSSWLNSFNKGYFFSVFLGDYVIAPFVGFVLLLCSVSAVIVKNRDRKTAK